MKEKLHFGHYIMPMHPFVLFHSSDNFIIIIIIIKLVKWEDNKNKERVDVPKCLTGSVYNGRIKHGSVFISICSPAYVLSHMLI